MQRHQARKRFGQHFLHDHRVIQQIVDAIAPRPNDHLVEIGPGLGALTFPLLKKCGQLDVIEIDRDLMTSLKERAREDELRIHAVDALAFDFNTLAPHPLRIVGNLPYNISTPLMFHLLQFTDIVTDMIFMLQKEVVERMSALPGSKVYGRLSVMMQYHVATTDLFDVPPSAFTPAPKVNSAVIRLVPHRPKPFLAKNYDFFADIVRHAFSHRRKTLRNSLKEIISRDQWTLVDIDPELRPEQLSVADYVTLSNVF